MNPDKIEFVLNTSRLEGKKLVLFGAGKCGQDYFLQLQKAHIPFVWLAGRPKWVAGYWVRHISEIADLEYDVVLIAISNIFTAADMRQQLFELNVPEQKILWLVPERSRPSAENGVDGCMCRGTNKIMGAFPELRGASIVFSGENNILYCEPHVGLKNSVLSFQGDDSIIYLGTGQFELNVSIFHNSAFYIGAHTTMNPKITANILEHSHCFIGNDVMFSWNVRINTADHHLIYGCTDKKRSNISKSVFIGDHVWLGQDALLLKGAQIDSGSIVGAESVVAGKKIGHNCVWAGNPCRWVRDDVFWDRSIPHDRTAEQTELWENYPRFTNGAEDVSDRFIYHYDREQALSFDDMDKALTAAKSAEEKLRYLKRVSAHNEKNRFVHA